MSQKFTQNGVATHIIVHGSEQWIGFKLPMWRCLRKDHQRPPTVHPVSSGRLSTWTNGLEKPQFGSNVIINFAAEHPPCKKAGLYKPRPQSQTCLRTRSHWPKFPGLVPLTHRAAELSSIQRKQHELQLDFVWFFPHHINKQLFNNKKISRIFLNELWFWKLHLQWWPSMTNLRAIDTLCTSGSHTGFNNLGGSSRSLGTVPKGFYVKSQNRWHEFPSCGHIVVYGECGRIWARFSGSLANGRYS